MGASYTRTQTGWLLRLFVILPTPFLVALGPVIPDRRAFYVLAPMIIVLTLVTMLFTTLTIEADAQELRWHFGPGVWRKKISRRDIVSAKAVRNPWWYGLGIHRTPHGWLYNVAGLDAVEVGLASGVTVRLGTDEPDKLAAVLHTRAGGG